MTTPTSNQVPSASPLDLLYNAEQLDKIVTSGALEYQDRLGVMRKTATGALAAFAGGTTRGAWTTATAYAPRDVVSNLSGGVTTWYMAVDTHTSGATFAGDLAAHWRVHQGVTPQDLASTSSVTDGPGKISETHSLNYAIGTLGAKLNNIYHVTDHPWLVIGDGLLASGDGAKVQAAIDFVSAAGGGRLIVPHGKMIGLDAGLTPKPNVTIEAEARWSSGFVVASAAAFDVFSASADIDNFALVGLKIDGSINYPADSKTYKQTYSLRNAALRVNNHKASNIKVSGCLLYKMSDSAVDINGFSSNGIRIRDNTFYSCGYAAQAVNIRVPSGSYTYAQRVYAVAVNDNTFVECGPQYHWDASKEDYCASSDAITIDSGRDSVVAGNTILSCCGAGVRIEESLRIKVYANTIVDSGDSGIVFYKDCTDSTCFGNTIVGWGRTPLAYAIRNYSGTYVVAREFPKSSGGPALPVDPTASVYWEVWPYSVASIDTASIVTYSASDYYSAPSTGILPYRGCAAIAYIQGTQNIQIHGNTCTGDATLDGSSKYLYASDWGVSPVHPTNDPGGAGSAGAGCCVLGNTIRVAREYNIYHPRYTDPVYGSGATGVATYGGNTAGTDVNYVFNTSLPTGINTEYNATLTVGGGSITQSHTRLAIVKTGRNVLLSGQLALSAVSSPTGSVTFNLPYAVSGEFGQRACYVGSYVYATGLTGVTTGHVVASTTAGSSTMTLSFYEAGSLSDLGAKLTATTAFNISMSYVAAT